MEPLHKLSTELLVLERERFDAGPIVILGDQDADDAELLVHELEDLECRFYVRYHSDLEQYEERGLTVDASWQPAVDPTVQTAIVFLSREKDVTELRVAAAIKAYPNVQEIFLLGHNKLGARTIHKRFRKQFKEVDKIASARHSGLIRLAKPRPEATDVLEEVWKSWTLDVDGTPLEIEDLPGVFSRGSLDRGSEMLIQSLGGRTQKRVLDLGCGAGVLSIAYATRVPDAKIFLVDHDAMATGSAQRNIEAHGLDQRATVIFGDVQSVADRQFELVITNPPFHVGSEMTTATAERWFASVKKLLEPGGEFILVANQHLPYGKKLEESFANVKILEEDSKFRIWSASKPR